MKRRTVYFPACAVLALLAGVLAEDFFERRVASESLVQVHYYQERLPHSWRDDPIILPAPPRPAKEPAHCTAWAVKWPCSHFFGEEGIDI